MKTGNNVYGVILLIKTTSYNEKCLYGEFLTFLQYQYNFTNVIQG